MTRRRQVGGQPGTVLLLDGATGTELQRLGVPVRPPWWTSGALRTSRGLEVLTAIHAGYVAVGTRVVTANTFRCNLRTLRRAGLGDVEAAAMVRLAVQAARDACSQAAVRPVVEVVGSMGPVEDCYRPDLVPDIQMLRSEHGWLARELVGAGVGTVLIETMNSLVEARTAVAAVLAVGGRPWVSFAAGANARLLSGEPVALAVPALEREGAEAVLVNCTSLADTEACLRVMAETARGPIGAYPNVEDRRGIPPATHVDWYVPALVDPAGLAEVVRRWVEGYHVRLVGGCCGTTPGHIAALRAALPATW